MARVMCRHAEDDFRALQTAEAMEEVGARVFSVVWTGRKNSLAYVVFARFEAPTTIEIVDEAIERKIFGEG